MKELVNRPVSVWIAQAVLALQAVSFLGLIGLRAVFANQQAIIPAEFMVWAALLGPLPLAAFIALTMRARIGRPLAIVSILCLWGVCIRVVGMLSVVTMVRNENAGIGTVSSSGSLVFVLLLFAIACLPILVFKLAFGKKAAEFFSRR